MTNQTAATAARPTGAPRPLDCPACDGTGGHAFSDDGGCTVYGDSLCDDCGGTGTARCEAESEAGRCAEPATTRSGDRHTRLCGRCAVLWEVWDAADLAWCVCGPAYRGVEAAERGLGRAVLA